VLTLITLGTLVLTPAPVLAQESSAGNAALQAQITALLAQITILRQRLAELSGTASLSCLRLAYNLYLGKSDRDTNGEVSKLQQFLAQDSSVYPEAQITGFFGPLTEQALQRWQSKNNVVSSGSSETTGYGVVGAQTRAAIAGRCGTVARGNKPSLTSISPRQGWTDTLITIYGSGFSAKGDGPTVGLYPNGSNTASTASATLSGGTSVPFVSLDGSMMQFKMGPVFTANVPAGPYEVRVANSEGVGIGTYSNPVYFVIGPTTTTTNYTPTITGTSAKAAGNFEMDAGGFAAISGSYLAGNSLSTTKVFIGGIQATLLSANNENENEHSNLLSIAVPPSLSAGQSYDLYVSNERGASNVVKIKILSNVSGQPSAGPFAITFPTTGAQLYAGETYNVTWTGSDQNVNSYSVYLSGGQLGAEMFLGTAYTSRVSQGSSFSWTIPASLASGNFQNYQIRFSGVESPAGHATTIFGIGSQTATQPSISITSPSSGTSVKRNTALTWTWSTFGDTSSVDVYLVTPAGQSLPFAKTYPNNGSFFWTAGASYTEWNQTISNGAYTIAVCPSGQIGAIGSQCGKFTVTIFGNTPVISVSYPVGGETFQAGGAIPVSFIGPQSGDQYTIELFQPAKGSDITYNLGTITGPSADQSKNTFTIPSAVPAGTYQVRVIQLTNQGTTCVNVCALAESNVFTVTAPPSTNASCPGSVTINGTTYTLSPCNINLIMTDGQGNKDFTTTVVSNGGSSSTFGYSVHGYGVGFPTYGILGGTSGGAVGNTTLHLTFNDSYLSANGNQPQTYTGYLPIHIYQGSEASTDNNYLNLNVTVTVNPAAI